MINLNYFKNLLPILVAFFFFLNTTNAQPREGRFLDASIGLGISTPMEDIDLTGTGFFAKAEYIFGFNKWVGVRPYAGILFTTPDDNEDYPGYGVSANIFLLGGKGRVALPIPYVAPYLELGLGLSVGNITTRTPFVDVRRKGVIPHIPVTLGLALGRDHNIEVAFAYYFHPSVKQINGAALIGMSFPLPD